MTPLLMPEKDLRYLQEKYAYSLKSGAGSPDSSEPSIEKDDRPAQDDKANEKNELLVYMLLILPFCLIICASVFTHVWVIAYPHFDLSTIFSIRTHIDTWRDGVIVSAMAIAPFCYILWLTFYLALYVLRIHLVDQYNILFYKLSTALACFIPVMWLWFIAPSGIFHLKRAFRYMISSATTSEAWVVLGMLITLFLLMVGIFFKRLSFNALP